MAARMRRITAAIAGTLFLAGNAHGQADERIASMVAAVVHVAAPLADLNPALEPRYAGPHYRSGQPEWAGSIEDRAIEQLQSLIPSLRIAGRDDVRRCLGEERMACRRLTGVRAFIVIARPEISGNVAVVRVQVTRPTGVLQPSQEIVVREIELSRGRSGEWRVRADRQVAWS